MYILVEMITLSVKKLSRYQRIELFWSLLWKGIGQNLKDFIDKDVDNYLYISERSEFFITVIELIKVCIELRI